MVKPSCCGSRKKWLLGIGMDKMVTTGRLLLHLQRAPELSSQWGPPQLAQSCKKITEEARSIVELKKFCSACNQEKDITEIEIYPQGGSVRLSCGHRIISVEFTESLGISEQIMAKHFDSSHKLESRYKTKTSGETRRPARDNIVIDRDSSKIIHQVWEQNQNGEWELVHDEEKPI